MKKMQKEKGKKSKKRKISSSEEEDERPSKNFGPEVVIKAKTISKNSEPVGKKKPVYNDSDSDEYDRGVTIKRKDPEV